jgi:hypothetical protein
VDVILLGRGGVGGRVGVAAVGGELVLRY